MYPILFSLPWSIPRFGPITVYTYGVLLAAAYLLGLQLAMVRARKRSLDATRVMDLGIYIIISALIGAKLLLLVTDFQIFRSNPAELFSLFRSGGVFYGGLILAVAVALVYIRRVGLPLGSPATWTTFVLATIVLGALVPVLYGIVPQRKGISKRSHVRAVASD